METKEAGRERDSDDYYGARLLGLSRPDGDAHLTEHMPAIYEQAELTDMEQVALRHIRANGDDRNLRSKRWKEVKSSLWRKGYLKRRIGDWAWIPRF
jgi:hypothetical protein